MARIQSWIEYTDPIFFGEAGEKGLIEEHNDDRQKERTRQEEREKNMKRLTFLTGFFAAIPVLLKLTELWHFLAK